MAAVPAAWVGGGIAAGGGRGGGEGGCGSRRPERDAGGEAALRVVRVPADRGGHHVVVAHAGTRGTSPYARIVSDVQGRPARKRGLRCRTPSNWVPMGRR